MSRRSAAAAEPEVEPGLGTLGYALLGLVADEPMNGYDLQKAFQLSLGNVWAARHSQIYPALAKLEKTGFITVVASGTRGSKIYGATPDGVRALRRWLQTDVPRATRNEAMLRMFFQWILEPDEAEALLRREKTYHQLRLARYHEIASMFPENPDRATRWSRIMLESGLRSEQTMIDWIEWASEELRKP